MVSFTVLKSSLRTKEYRSKTEVGLAKKSRKQNACGWRCKEKTCGKDERKTPGEAGTVRAA